MRDMTRFHFGKPLIAGVVSTSLVLTGCAGSAALKQKYAEADDSCEVHRAPVYDSQDQFDQKVWESALVGTLLGVGAGLLLGGGSRGQAALIGGAIGLASGLTAGYLRSKASKAKSRQELLTSINGDITADTMRLGSLGTALRQLNDCRERQLDSLRDDIVAGRIAKPAAREELARIRTAMRNDNALFEEVFGKVDERGTMYVEATATTQGVEQEMVLGKTKSYRPKLSDASADESEAAKNTYVLLKNANVRSEPSTDSKILGLIKRGATIESGLLEKGSSWYPITYEGKKAFLHESLLAPEGEGKARPSVTVQASDPERPKVIKANFPGNAKPIEKFVTDQADLKAQQSSDRKFLEQKADTIDVLLDV